MTTIRTSDLRELLALIPFNIGFHPRKSVVVISVRAGGAVGLIARADLPDLTSESTGPDLASSLIGHLLADGAQRVEVILYCDDDLQSSPERGETAVGRLNRAARGLLPDIEAWVVGPRGYYSLGCRDLTCCPPGGRDLDGLHDTQVGAEMVLRGTQVLDKRSDLGRLPNVPQADRRAARAAAGRWAERARTARAPQDLVAWRRAGLELWRRLVDDPHPRPTDLGKLAQALTDVLVRDAVLVDLVPGRSRIAERVTAGWSGPEVADALRAITGPDGAERPDEDQHRAAGAVLESLAAHRPRQSAPAWTLLGLLSWWRGDGARAAVQLERALSVEPGYRLAALIDQAVAQGLPPGWVRASRVKNPISAGGAA